MRFLDANVFIYAKPRHELTEKQKEMKIDVNDCLR